MKKKTSLGKSSNLQGLVDEEGRGDEDVDDALEDVERFFSGVEALDEEEEEDLCSVLIVFVMLDKGFDGEEEDDFWRNSALYLTGAPSRISEG